MTGNEGALGMAQRALAGNQPGMFQCLSNGKGEMPEEEYLHVRTPLLYPGAGGPINVYVRANRSNYTVTDRGTTMNALGRHLSVDTGQRTRWEPMARKICEGLDVNVHGGEWTVPARTPEDVGKAAMTLAQALLRMSIMTPIFKILNDR